MNLLHENGIRGDLIDERCAGESLSVGFAGTLRTDQEAAVTAMLRHDTGVLCAPTAFGKTVIAAALIARRGVNTLVLVHRRELLRQWQERLHTFLTAGAGVSAKNLVGVVGGGKVRPTGKIAATDWIVGLTNKDAQTINTAVIEFFAVCEDLR